MNTQNGNRLYLVCQHCPTEAAALLIAHRPGNDVQYTASSGASKTDKWFAKHLKCGNGCDKFALAYEAGKDWDVSPPADPVAASVRVAIATAPMEHPAGADWREPVTEPATEETQH